MDAMHIVFPYSHYTPLSHKSLDAFHLCRLRIPPAAWHARTFVLELPA